MPITHTRLVRTQFGWSRTEPEVKLKVKKEESPITILRYIPSPSPDPNDLPPLLLNYWTNLEQEALLTESAIDGELDYPEEPDRLTLDLADIDWDGISRALLAVGEDPNIRHRDDIDWE